MYYVKLTIPCLLYKITKTECPHFAMSGKATFEDNVCLLFLIHGRITFLYFLNLVTLISL